jgi:metal-responsive CopG/Arc/MetJ family transcriptional regulator
MMERTMPDRKGRYTTISIPRDLYEEVKQTVQDTEFRSPTEYIVYLTRQAVHKGKHTAISIPRELYERVAEIIQDTGFGSPAEYIVYLTRQAVIAIEADRQLIHSLPYSVGRVDEEK